MPAMPVTSTYFARTTAVLLLVGLLTLLGIVAASLWLVGHRHLFRPGDRARSSYDAAHSRRRPGAGRRDRAARLHPHPGRDLSRPVSAGAGRHGRRTRRLAAAGGSPPRIRAQLAARMEELLREKMGELGATIDLARGAVRTKRWLWSAPTAARRSMDRASQRFCRVHRTRSTTETTRCGRRDAVELGLAHLGAHHRRRARSCSSSAGRPCSPRATPATCCGPRLKSGR